MAMTGAEIQRRRRARQRGEDVPKMPPGPKQGYKQTADHIEKRKRFGAEHHGWKGNNITIASGRNRAERKFPSKPCQMCGKRRAERHHVDENTANNDPANVVFLCRKCHMKVDGRYDRFIELAKANQPFAVASRWH